MATYIISILNSFTKKIIKLSKYVWWLFSSTGASFDSAMQYCDEQYYYHLGKQIQK